MVSVHLKSRLERIFRKSKGIDKILIFNMEDPHLDPNFFYATGFRGLFEYSYLILQRDGARLVTSMLEYETAKAQAPEGMEIVCIKSRDELKTVLGKELNGFRVGINESFLPVQVYKSLKKNYKTKKILDVSEKLSEARMVKDGDEIANIKKAVSITKWALVLIQKEFKEGMTEAQLAAKFNNLCSSMGSDGPSFTTLVCFGKNAAMPHHFPDETKLRYGDFILIDAGSKVNNYCSDMTRTFIYADPKKGTKGNHEMEEVLKIVKEAQLRAIKGIKPGMKGKEIDKIARGFIESADGGKYKGKFIHSLGHSLGLEVHDGPGFSPNEESVITEGMVVTVEPGIYINGFGGVRIEDDVLVTRNGALVL